MTAGTALALAACAHASSESTSATASATPVAPRSSAPVAPADAAATFAAPASASTERAAAPASTKGAAAAPRPAAPMPTGTPAGPQIYSLSSSTSVVRAGQSISFSALTTPDIQSVVANVSAYTLPFTRTGSGRFSLAFAIPPNVPGLFHGTYALDVTARSQAGASVHRSISITFE